MFLLFSFFYLCVFEFVRAGLSIPFGMALLCNANKTHDLDKCDSRLICCWPPYDAHKHMCVCVCVCIGIDYFRAQADVSHYCAHSNTNSPKFRCLCLIQFAATAQENTLHVFLVLRWRCHAYGTADFRMDWIFGALSYVLSYEMVLSVCRLCCIVLLHFIYTQSQWISNRWYIDHIRNNICARIFTPYIIWHACDAKLSIWLMWRQIHKET